MIIGGGLWVLESRSKQVKVVFDGKEYWLLWHWEDLVSPLAPAQPLASGPFPNIEEATKVASEAEKHSGWIILPFSKQS
ncbi:MAG: hypothetical protein WAN03_17200 [Candidatus Sulfotelmatobacter sp.]